MKMKVNTVGALSFECVPHFARLPWKQRNFIVPIRCPLNIFDIRPHHSRQHRDYIPRLSRFAPNGEESSAEALRATS